MYDGTKPNITQDMLAFEASIRENQDGIRTGSGFKFTTINLENTLSALLTVKTTTTGAANAASVGIYRGDQANGSAVTTFATGGTNDWSLGLRAGDRRFHFRDDVEGVVKFIMTGGSGTSWFGTPTAASLVLGTNSTDRLTIDTAGNVGIGGSGTIAKRLHVRASAANVGEIIQNTDGTNAFVQTFVNANGQVNYMVGAGITAFGWYTGATDFAAAGATQRMTLTSAGTLFVANATTVPTTNPTGGATWYVEGGASKVRGASGTVTTFAPADPHCPVCGGDFVLEQYNDTTGRYLSICWDCWSEEKGQRDWIIRRAREPRTTNSLADITRLRSEREATADALIAADLSGSLPVEPVVAPTDPLSL